MEPLFTIEEGAEPMGWVKLEDGVFAHPKVLSVGPQAALLFIASLCWSGANNTDGAIPEYALRRLASDIDVSETVAHELAEKLVDVRAPGSHAGLWEQTLVGWLIHDWCAYQTDAEDRKAAKAERDRKAAQQRRNAARAVTNGTVVAADLQGISANGQICMASDQDFRRPSEAEAEEEIKNYCKPVGLQAEFDVWWGFYPRHREKQAARVAYDAQRRAGADPEDILTAARNYANSVLDADPHMVKLPATFLNKSRWRDWAPGGDALNERRKAVVREYDRSDGTTIMRS